MNDVWSLERQLISAVLQYFDDNGMIDAARLSQSVIGQRGEKTLSQVSISRYCLAIVALTCSRADRRLSISCDSCDICDLLCISIFVFYLLL